MQPDLNLPDPDMALTDPKGYQQQLTQYIAGQNAAMLNQAAGPVYMQLATQAREMSRNDPKNKAIWDKYGADVEQMVVNVPQHARTKELYDKAVVMVKGEKFDELAAEKAATLASAGTGLTRSGGEGSDDDAGDDDVWDKIASSPMGKAALHVAGKKGILAAVRAGAYKSLDDYAAAATKSKAKVDPANPNVIRDYVRK